MTASAATERNGVGRDGGTSQCRGNNDDRNSVQHGFPHGRYPSLFQMTRRCRCVACISGIERCREAHVFTALRSVCLILRQLSPACGNRSCTDNADKLAQRLGMTIAEIKDALVG
jgi:hypothetical protein